ncbi:hypothetical protein VWY69_00265 [Phaeobacter sp. A90a-4k]|uniref:hypothetical protein n=1 Tax=unclassified Phaeobacter TaxID=2621772 RepID=UPI003A894C4A
MFNLNHPKLTKLAEFEGYGDVMDFLEAVAHDSIVPAICMADDCEMTAELEPDQDRGFCETCARNTVKSALVIAGVI